MSSKKYEHVLSPPGCFTAEEMQFLAEDIPTSIVSNFSTEKDKPLRLIQGEVPGFVAAFSRSVPMWLCLSLKRQGKCRVNIDELKLNFMDSKASSLILRREKLIKLPTRLNFFFAEVSELIFRGAREDFDDWHVAYDTLLQLAAIRQQKLRAKLKHMHDAHHNLREEEARQTKADAILLFNYYSASELNLVRRFVQQGARGFHRTRTRS